MKRIGSTKTVAGSSRRTNMLMLAEVLILEMPNRRAPRPRIAIAYRCRVDITSKKKRASKPLLTLAGLTLNSSSCISTVLNDSFTTRSTATRAIITRVHTRRLTRVHTRRQVPVTIPISTEELQLFPCIQRPTDIDVCTSNRCVLGQFLASLSTIKNKSVGEEYTSSSAIN